MAQNSARANQVGETLSDDVAALTRLNELAVRFVGSDDLQAVLKEIVDAAIELTHAAKGNLQLFNAETKTLRIAAARGFSESWLRFFDTVSDDGASCAAAMNIRARVIVEDVRTNPIFVGKAALEVQLREGVMAVQSTPLISRSGELLGMLSTHFAVAHKPTDREFHWLDLLARQAADLLERRRTEEALRESESRKSAILNSALDCIITIDEESRIVEVNAAFERTFGYAGSEVAGKSMAELIIPERYRAAHYRGLARYKETREGPLLGRRVEITAIRRDGTEFPVELGIVPIKRERGHLFTGTLRDITERKRGEKALRESEERFRAVFNQQFQFMAVLSPEGKLLEVNDLPLRIAGVTRDQVVGKIFWETPWWRDLPEMREAWPARLAAAAKATGPVLSEDHYQTADGGVRVADAAVTAVKGADGRVEGFIVQANDISERKRAEAGMRESEERFRTLAENIPQLAWATNADGWIFWYNRRWFDYTGTTLEEMQGWGWQKVHHPEHVERVTEKFKRALASGEPWEDTFPLRGKDGHFRWFLSRAFPIRDSEGRITRWFGTNTDITQQRESEQALAQQAQELEKRVKERTRSLNESMEALETLLYTIAHDLRAPNRAMQGYAQLLRDGYSGKMDEQGRFLVERILGAAVKNERLIHDLLEFGRLAHAELPCKAMNPQAAIGAVLVALEAEIRRSGASVQVAEAWPEVWANDSALGHALTNLVSNGLKYVAPDTRPRMRIHPRVTGPKKAGEATRVRICIEDNGIGVASDQHERIFEPFQRAVGGTYEGTGMGLAIVRKAAERMGGTAGVESTVGQGSCFWIELLGGDGQSLDLNPSQRE